MELQLHCPQSCGGHLSVSDGVVVIIVLLFACPSRDIAQSVSQLCNVSAVPWKLALWQAPHGLRRFSCGEFCTSANALNLAISDQVLQC